MYNTNKTTMVTIQSFTNDDKKYLLLEDIKKSNVNKAYFIGCKTMRKVIDKHGVPDEVCLYMKSGIIYNKSYNPANLYVEEQYAKENIMNTNVLMKKKKEIADTKTEMRTKEKLKRKAYNEDELTNEPPLIDLEEHEMFKDLDGSPMDIEVRGKKTDDGIYFKAKDIGIAFDYDLVEQTILDMKSDHVYGEHFKYFICLKKVSGQMEDKKVLYLTYLGVLKLLLCARGDKAKRFQRWVTKIIFTMQMGSQDDKVSLAAEALNVDKSTITQLFKKSCKEIPCVYLFEVGTVGNMRQHFNLDKFTNDNDKVYKYGMSNNMARRSAEHQKTFGKLTDNSFQLTVFSYIDTLFTSKAETKLKHSFDCMKIHLEDERYNELVVIEKNQIQSITELYRDIHTCYAGMNSDIIHQMQEMQVIHQMELNKKETTNKLLQKDIMLYKKDIELLNTQLDLERTKHQNHLQEAELNMLRKMMNK